MTKICLKRELNPTVTLMEVEAPLIARRARPGQFIILRVDEQGERIPLTIADYDRERGTVTIIFQKVGHTTRLLGELEAGEDIRDFVGPLGQPTEIPEGTKRVCVIGGGVGCAIAYPQAKALHAQGVAVDVIVGFRSRDLVILEEEFRAVSDRFFLMTDDGSVGEQGLVTQKLQERIEGGANYDLVIAIGPIPMIKFVCKGTEPYGIKTLVSLNPLMIDGTGMCGCCRVTVGGQVRFVCVDGPDFDGHQVDFEELMARNGTYRAQEEQARADHVCRMDRLGRHLIP